MLIKLNGYIYYLGCPVINKFRFIQKSKFSASDKIIMIFSQMKTMFSFVFPRLSPSLYHLFSRKAAKENPFALSKRIGKKKERKKQICSSLNVHMAGILHRNKLCEAFGRHTKGQGKTQHAKEKPFEVTSMEVLACDVSTYQ